MSANSGPELSHEYISQQLTPVDSMLCLQTELLFFSRIILLTHSGLPHARIDFDS